jgi:hypothetical protein
MLKTRLLKRDIYHNLDSTQLHSNVIKLRAHYPTSPVLQRVVRSPWCVAEGLLDYALT